MLRKFTLLLAAYLFVAACQSDDAEPDNNIVDGSELPNDKTTWWKPANGVSFDWDLDELNAGDQFSADVVDVDAFTTTAEQVAALHAQGKKVIAYMSVGTLEDDRPDAGLLPREVIGKVYPEWPEERWLDIRQPEKLKPWLSSRLRMIMNKGFDAVEPDNLDSYDNETGFDISITDTRRYCDYLITLAHQNGLGIGQKNVPDLAPDYAAKFDWLLTEDAFEQGWQDQVQPFTALNKPVFAAEYTDMTSRAVFENNFCPKAKSLKVYVVLKHRNLDKWASTCP
ncbi:endo alpha-1,4 polygalactosaminidase [Dyadobacter sp.]|uniref:endo alpha-1,4 polygalactosaminidase n=1 Tax=Dyadobacter sp. TaxID=1914288 RepID=UPI003F6F30CF